MAKLIEGAGGLIGSLLGFRGESPLPEPEKEKPMPSPDDRAAKRKALALQKKRKGRKSTVLTLGDE